MGNIFTDVVDDINLKPSKSKTVLKWVVRIAVALIIVAFGWGQVKVLRLNKINEFEKTLQENTKANVEMRKEMQEGFKAVNNRIDKVYDDGNKAFNDWTIFSKDQLKMVIDYGQTNKEMLKRMLDLNTVEKTKTVENQLEQAKTIVPETKKDTFNIMVRPVKK